MPPHHLLLLSELSGISAASKLFFVKLLQRFPEKTSFCFGVKLFASELAVCSGLLIPDTNLGENDRHREVSDDKATSDVFH